MAPAAVCWWSWCDPPLVDQWLVGPQHQVAVNDEAYRQAGAAGQGGLDVEVATGDFLAYLVNRVLGAVPAGDDDAIAVLAVFGRGQFGAHAEQRGQGGACENAIPVPVHAIL